MLSPSIRTFALNARRPLPSMTVAPTITRKRERLLRIGLWLDPGLEISNGDFSLEIVKENIESAGRNITAPSGVFVRLGRYVRPKALSSS
jgi:hypothetical protein